MAENKVQEMDMHTDAELAALVQSGNADAFVELTARYMELVRAKVAPLRGDFLEDDDLCQEGLLGLYHAACTFSPDGGALFSTYAGACIRNQLVTAYRRVYSKRRMPPHGFVPLADHAVPETSTRAEDPEAVVLARERLEAVRRLIAENLTPLEQSVLMRYLGGSRYTQIADTLGITPKAVDNALHRVRIKLKTLS